MAYGAQAIQVVKANRALLKKRNTFKQVKEMYLDTVAGKTELEFKEVSPEKLAKIKAEIRRKAKADAWKEVGIYIGCTIAVLYGVYWLVFT